MSGRNVIPEILDRLPPEDPEARRSRRDLRRINFLMGNERWICRAVRKFSAAALRGGIVELGAGDGMLVGKLAHSFPDALVTGCDLAPRPDGLASHVVWKQGDLLSADYDMSGGILISNLFLHHFEGASLRQLGRLCSGFEILVFNEPDRAIVPHLLGGTMWPMINRVTRHDMHVSINAGFANDEMQSLMGLNATMWSLVETYTWRGARRVLGCRL